MPLAFGYCRDSTSLPATVQMQEIKAWFDSRTALDASLKFGGFMVDKATTGKTTLVERPYGALLDSRLQSGDTVVCVKLGDMFRNARDAWNVIQVFRVRGIGLVLLDLNVNTCRGEDEKFFAMLTDFADWERTRISERTKEGLAARRARGLPHALNSPRGWKIAAPRSGGLKKYVPDYDGIAFGYAIVMLRDRHGIPVSDIQLSAGVIGKSNLGNNTVFAWERAARAGFLFNGKDPLRIPEVKAKVMQEAEVVAQKILGEVLRRKGHWAKRHSAAPPATYAITTAPDRAA